MRKNDYINFKRCPKEYWLGIHKKEVATKPDDYILENFNLVYESFLKSFGDDIVIIDRKENDIEMCNETLNLIQNNVKVIGNAHFIVDNEFILNIDVLKFNDDNTVSVNIVSSKTEISKKSECGLSYDKYLLTRLGFNVKECNVFYINNEYIKNGDYEWDKLFKKETIDEYLYDFETVDNDLKEIKEITKFDIKKVDLDICCNKPAYDKKSSRCPFFEYCTKDLPKPNVFDIRGNSPRFDKKINHYKNGIITFEDIVENLADVGTGREQVNFEYNNLSPYIDKKSIEDFLNTLTFPMYFLDFETFYCVIPFADGMRPYEQIVSQYSLHILEEKNGKLIHKEYLAKEGTNTKREVAEQLIKDIPKDVCVIVYNKAFEQGRIKAMAKDFPDLEEHLMNIHDNIKDLMIPFQKKYYYQKEFQGSYSIKQVLPAFYPNDSKLDYNKLDGIHNGGEAMEAFATLHEKTDEEIKEIRQQLLDYCYLDTLAMVKILEKLWKIVEG